MPYTRAAVEEAYSARRVGRGAAARARPLRAGGSVRAEREETPAALDREAQPRLVIGERREGDGVADRVALEQGGGHLRP